MNIYVAWFIVCIFIIWLAEKVGKAFNSDTGKPISTTLNLKYGFGVIAIIIAIAAAVLLTMTAIITILSSFVL